MKMVLKIDGIDGAVMVRQEWDSSALFTLAHELARQNVPVSIVPSKGEVEMAPVWTRMFLHSWDRFGWHTDQACEVCSMPRRHYGDKICKCCGSKYEIPPTAALEAEDAVLPALVEDGHASDEPKHEGPF